MSGINWMSLLRYKNLKFNEVAQKTNKGAQIQRISV